MDEIENLKEALAIRERQLSMVLAKLEEGKDSSTLLLYNQAGEFIDIVRLGETAGTGFFIAPKKLVPILAAQEGDA